MTVLGLFAIGLFFNTCTQSDNTYLQLNSKVIAQIQIMTIYLFLIPKSPEENDVDFLKIAPKLLNSSLAVS